MPAYRFDLSEEDYEEMTPFSRNQYDYIMNENTVILRPNLIEQLTPINYLATKEKILSITGKRIESGIRGM